MRTPRIWTVLCAGFASLTGCSGKEGPETSHQDASWVPDAAGTRPDAASALVDARPAAAPDAATAPPPDGAPPLDAGPAPTPETWQPTPQPWVSYPDHPFRSRIVPAADVHDLEALTGGARVLAAGDDGLTIWERDAQGGVEGIATVALGSPALDVAASGDGRLAALAAGRVTLVSLDDPLRPTVRGALALPAPVRSVAVAPDGGTVFATSAGGLTSIDVRMPDAPSLLGTLPLDGLDHLVAAPEGGVLFAADDEGLVVVSVESPSAPTVLSRLAIANGIEGLALAPDGETLFVARWQGVSVVDVRSRAAPALVDGPERETAGFVSTAVPSPDGRLLVNTVDGAMEVRFLDELDAPRPQGAFEFGGSIRAVAFAGPSHALLATSDGLRSIDLREPWGSPLVGSLSADRGTCAGLRDVAVTPDARTAFIAGRSGLMTVDLSAPETPTLRGVLAAPAINLALSPDGRSLYAAGESALLAFDATGADGPRPTARFDDPSATPQDVAVSGDGTTAYLATELGGGLDVIALGPEHEPVRTGQTYIRHTQSLVLAADGQTVFVADFYENGLMAFDVRDPTTPSLRGNLRLPVHEMALAPGGAILAATDDSGLLLVDATDPDLLPVVSVTPEVSTIGRVAFSADGQRLAVTDNAGGITVLDVSRPERPIVTAVFDTPGTPTGLAFLADTHGAVVTATDTSPCVMVVDLGRPPSLTPMPSPGDGTRRYRMSWADRHPEHPERIAWHATAGTVTISDVNQLEHTATVDWTPPPDDALGATLSVAVGNHHAFQIARATSPE